MRQLVNAHLFYKIILSTQKIKRSTKIGSTWWRHQMETFSALLALCAGNSPVPGEFPTQRPVTRSFDVYFDLRPNKRLGKQSWGWWFQTLSWSLWRHRNELVFSLIHASCWFQQRVRGLSYLSLIRASSCYIIPPTDSMTHDINHKLAYSNCHLLHEGIMN